MKAFMPVLALALLMPFGGCATITADLNAMSDTQLAAYLQLGATNVARTAIVLANQKWPNKAAAIKTDGIALEGAIRNVILPALSGVSGSQVTQAALTQIFTDLGAKAQTTTLATLELSLNAVLLEIPLPGASSKFVSSRGVTAAVGFLVGIATGIEQAEGLPVPPPPAPPAANPPPAPTPAPTPAPVPPVPNKP